MVVKCWEAQPWRGQQITNKFVSVLFVTKSKKKTEIKKYDGEGRGAVAITYRSDDRNR